jgi:hypothetical protein
MATAAQPGKGPQQKPKIAAKPPAPAKKPPAGDNDELQLQPHNDEEDKPKPVRRGRRHAAPEPVAGGKPLDVGDTSRLLVYAGIFAVAAILVAGWLLLKPENKPVTAAPSTPDASTPAKPASGSNAPSNNSKKPDAPVAPADYTVNPANKTCYFAYAKFMSWAYVEGLELDGKTLTEKFKAEVSTTGLTDPDLIQLCAQSLEMFKLGGDKALRKAAGIEVRVDEAGRGTMTASKEAKEIKAINVNLRILSRQALQRYGQPELYQSTGKTTPTDNTSVMNPSGQPTDDTPKVSQTLNAPGDDPAKAQGKDPKPVTPPKHKKMDQLD